MIMAVARIAVLRTPITAHMAMPTMAAVKLMVTTYKSQQKRLQLGDEETYCLLGCGAQWILVLLKGKVKLATLLVF